MPLPHHPFYLANKPHSSSNSLPVTDKYTGRPIASVSLADAPAIDRAIAAAVNATEPMRHLPAYQRRDVLLHCVKRFSEKAEELARTLCLEAGKPIKDARGEVTRLIDTFRLASEEATRVPNSGGVLPMDISPRGRNLTGLWKRLPIGPCSFITPFNFPLNLIAHKVAPAIAAGCPFILKPASYTPLSAIHIAAVLAETDLPPGAFSFLPCSRDAAGPFTTDPRLKFLSFTGSAEVGWDLKARAGKKKVTLELGGNAAVIIDHDADLDDAVPRIITGAFYQSGQSCISVQRILIHQSIYPALRDKVITLASTLKSGDPKLEETSIGPLITENDAQRVESWINAATKRGATLLCGGRRNASVLQPSLLENVPEDEPLSCEEVFGPVAVLSSFTDFNQALALVNRSRFGLQAGVFTRDLNKALHAWNTLEVGAVLINESPSFRLDHMPYGGSKDSGQGREGVKWAMEEMTEPRLLLIRESPAGRG